MKTNRIPTKGFQSEHLIKGLRLITNTAIRKTKATVVEIRGKTFLKCCTCAWNCISTFSLGLLKAIGRDRGPRRERELAMLRKKKRKKRIRMVARKGAHPPRKWKRNLRKKLILPSLVKAAVRHPQLMKLKVGRIFCFRVSIVDPDRVLLLHVIRNQRRQADLSRIELLFQSICSRCR